MGEELYRVEATGSTKVLWQGALEERMEPSMAGVQQTRGDEVRGCQGPHSEILEA